MKTVDAYLSRKVQAVWPGAVVYKLETGRFTLERGNGKEDLDLGAHFGEAKASVHVIVQAELARKGSP
jgi:hypothetical protein